MGEATNPGSNGPMQAKHRQGAMTCIMDGKDKVLPAHLQRCVSSSGSPHGDMLAYPNNAAGGVPDYNREGPP